MENRGVRYIGKRKPLKPGFGGGNVTKKLYRQFKRLFIDAADAYISELCNHIAVDSGMSMASLEPLAAQLKTKKALIAVLRGRGPRFKRKPYKAYGEFSSAETMKSQAAGRRLGKEAYTLDFGDDMHPVFVFGLKINVLQWFLNENGLGNVPLPPHWNGLKLSEKVFINYITHNWRDYMPDFNRWMFENKLLSLTGKPLR